MAKILYISQSYMPSRRADSVQVMHMCEALASRGHEVEVLSKKCPSRFEPDVADDFSFYGIEPAFKLRKLSRPAPRGGGVVFAAAVSSVLRARSQRPDLSYCRFLWGALESVRLGIPTVYETHGMPLGTTAGDRFQKLVRSPHLKRLVVITAALESELASTFSFDESLVTIAPDAVRRSFAERFADGVAAPNPPRVGYVGHLYRGRGIPTIIELARRFPEIDFEIVGGHDHHIADWQRLDPPSNLEFSGFVPPHELHHAYARLGILLMPHEAAVGTQSGTSDIARWTSPMKMFEYMATGRPILASRLPVLREVLEHERNALLVERDDVDAWERALGRLIAEPELARRLGGAAREDVLGRYTWDIRAGRILAGLEI